MKLRVLHCHNGDHDFTRAPQRGRLPQNCPDHQAPPPRNVPVRVVPGSETGDYSRSENVPEDTNDLTPLETPAERAERLTMTLAALANRQRKAIER